MASLDLCAAFDVVHIKILLHRLKILGSPSDVINLIKVWLIDRSWYAHFKNLKFV